MDTQAFWSVIGNYNERKNKALLVLLAIWGLTGIKSIIFNAYEDMILLICGLYATVLLVQEVRRSKEA